MTYDNIKSPRKQGLHPLSRRYIFGKTTGGIDQSLPVPAFEGLKQILQSQKVHKFSCVNCNVTYYGKTELHLNVRSTKH